MLLIAEAICATIQTNIIELNTKRGDIKQLVDPVAKRAAANQVNDNGNDNGYSIGSDDDTVSSNGNGNGKKLIKNGAKKYYVDA